MVASLVILPVLDGHFGKGRRVEVRPWLFGGPMTGVGRNAAARHSAGFSAVSLTDCLPGLLARVLGRNFRTQNSTAPDDLS